MSQKSKLTHHTKVRTFAQYKAKRKAPPFAKKNAKGRAPSFYHFRAKYDSAILTSSMSGEVHSSGRELTNAPPAYGAMSHVQAFLNFIQDRSQFRMRLRCPVCNNEVDSTALRMEWGSGGAYHCPACNELV